MRRLLSTVAGLLVAAAVHAHPPVGIVIDRDGNVFYSDLTHVWRIAPDGKKSIAVAHVHTHELYLDDAGVLFGEHLWYEGEASDTWGHRVWKRTRDGRVSDVIPARRGFLTNYSFVRDGNGTMYWVDRERSVIMRRKESSVPEMHARHRFRDARWMTVASEGMLFLIDDGDLLRIDRGGKVSVLVRDLPGGSLTRPHVSRRHRLMGLWPGNDGSVFVADYGAGEVKRVDPQGKVSVVAKSRWPWSPTGGTFDRDGGLWILEASPTNAVRARKVK